jgi:hypothetical protein
MRRLACSFVFAAGLAGATPAPAQVADTLPSYLRWTAAEAERVGKATRVTGRVGGVLDFRIVHTEHAYNYKLRATWLSKEVIQATARLQQIADRLSDSDTQALVQAAMSAGDIVMLVEVDPREGSGVIPNDWSAFLAPAAADGNAVRGTNTPGLASVRALRGVYRRDYNYELFWVVFPAVRQDGEPLFGPDVTHADLSVRIFDKEGRVSFKIPGR